MNARDDFGQLLAAGLITIFAIQTIIILGRRHSPAAADGHHAPVHVLRRLEPAFELHPDRDLLVRISHHTAGAPAPAHTAEILIGGTALMQTTDPEGGHRALIVAFIAIFVQLNYVQIFAAEEIAEQQRQHPERFCASTRSSEETSSRSTGSKRARSEDTEDGSSTGARIRGASSTDTSPATTRSSTGRPASKPRSTTSLLGDSGVISMQDIEDRFLGSGRQGDDVRLTIHSRLQEVATDALGGERGAVVALDPRRARCERCGATPPTTRTRLASFDAKEAQGALGVARSRRRRRAR